MDWDKLRIFHAAAEAGSFTHAGETLGMSQSAISRQVSALEADLGLSLFHRHARGLILTEQGELLFRTAREVLLKLQSVRSRLADAKDEPEGVLRVTTTLGLGSTWLTARLREFLDLYPKIQLDLILDDEELDLSMREADVAIRLRQPTQPDLIQRRLFTVHFHVFASQDYAKEHGLPATLADLDNHRILTYGSPSPQFLKGINYLETAGRPDNAPRAPALRINNVYGLRKAVLRGIGIALLPDYIIEQDRALVQAPLEADLPSFDTFFAYPEELKNTAKVSVFRDFLIANARRWTY
ncbi:MAG: LysR family transcriptional regulator [Hyphomicrobiaceae bacterium]|nr:LysR family transcriptional regulator [Hyphomicrobiaceae bacterium]